MVGLVGECGASRIAGPVDSMIFGGLQFPYLVAVLVEQVQGVARERDTACLLALDKEGVVVA